MAAGVAGLWQRLHLTSEGQLLQHEVQQRFGATELTHPAPTGEDHWGFAHLPPVAELLHAAEQARQEERQHLSSEADDASHLPGNSGRTAATEGLRCQPAACASTSAAITNPCMRGCGKGCLEGTYLSTVSSSRTFRSPHCEPAMAAALGVSNVYEAVVGSVAKAPATDAGVDQVRAVIKLHINSNWALEAVKQGVAHAKTGNYEEAHRCYAKAVELHPTCCDAYVARGAAYANERHLQRAADDFEAALQLDPCHLNARKYLDAVKSHLQAAELEQRQRQQQQQQQQLVHIGSARPTSTPGGTPLAGDERQAARAKDPLQPGTASGPEPTVASLPSTSGLNGAALIASKQQQHHQLPLQQQQPLPPSKDAVRRALQLVRQARGSDGQHQKKHKHKRHKAGGA